LRINQPDVVDKKQRAQYIRDEHKKVIEKIKKSKNIDKKKYITRQKQLLEALKEIHRVSQFVQDGRAHTEQPGV